MKIIHLIKTTEGASWAFKQIEQLKKLGCDVYVILPDDRGFYRKYIDIGITPYVLNIDFMSLIKKPFLFIKNIVKFREILCEIKPEIIHSHFVGTTYFMRLAMFGLEIKKIFQVPGPLHLESFLPRKIELLLANRYDYWISTCNLSKDIYLRNGILDSRIKTIFYGTDISLYSPDNEAYLRKEFSISDSTKIIGMVAYAYAPKKYLFQKRGIKGHEDLIDAVSILLEKRKDIVCVFIGGAWHSANDYYKSIVEYGKHKLGEHVLFLGSRKDVPYLYPDLDLVVHPSHSENLGGAAESLLMSVPTIASNIGGFPDIVIPGKTGWLVPCKDPVSLANTIQEVLEHKELAKELAKNGRTLLLDALNVKNTAKDVFDFYNDILNSRRV